MKKIVFFTYGLVTGGIGRHLTYLIKGLHDEGFESHVITFIKGGMYWDELEKWGNCHLVSLDWKGKWDFLVIPKLANYVKQNQIDLIRSELPIHQSYASIAGMIAKTPVLMTIHNSTIDHDGLQSIIAAKIAKFFSYSYIVKKIICTSHKTKELHLKLGYSKNKMCVIPNAISIPKNIVWSKPLSHKPPWHIGIIARYHTIKDHPLLFKVIAKLKNKYPIILDMYGDGSEQYCKILKQQIKDLGIDSEVNWHGYTTNVWNALNNIDILVSASWGETTPYNILEGMAAGRIIIATDVGDLKRMLNGNLKCGYIVPPKNPTAFAKAIENVLEQPEIAQKLAKNAQQVVKKNYSADAMVKANVSLYRKIIG